MPRRIFGWNRRSINILGQFEPRMEFAGGNFPVEEIQAGSTFFGGLFVGGFSMEVVDFQVLFEKQSEVK